MQTLRTKGLDTDGIDEGLVEYCTGISSTEYRLANCRWVRTRGALSLTANYDQGCPCGDGLEMNMGDL